MIKWINNCNFGDCRNLLRNMASDGVRVQTCVTSPPYFGLRDYGHTGQIGLEQTPEEYIAAMVEVFRCVRDVLTDDGTLWLNIGDSYGTGKQLLMIPARVALALQSDGWVLRQDIVWNKPNPMPESVRDRCTKAHEYIFLLSKYERYFIDPKGISEPAKYSNITGMDGSGFKPPQNFNGKHSGGSVTLPPRKNVSGQHDGKRNRRSVWTVPTRPYKGAHFATFPPALIEPCILAGSRPGDIVLDPFMGSGTTAYVSRQHGRRYIGCELNLEYKHLQDERLCQTVIDLDAE